MDGLIYIVKSKVIIRLSMDSSSMDGLIYIVKSKVIIRLSIDQR